MPDMAEKIRTEARRRRAVALVRKGATFAEAAREVGVSGEAVRLWWAAFKEGGRAALKTQGKLGRPRGATDAELRGWIAAARAASPRAWTATDVYRLAQAAGTEISIRVVQRHVRRLVRRK